MNSTAAAEQRKQILLIEDDAALIATLRDELEASGFAVDPATTSEEALRKVEERPPNLILLDLLLSGKSDGMSILSRLKQSGRVKDVPIVVLSNAGDDEVVQQALDLGADASFRKTRYGLPDLLERIRVLLGTGRG